MDEPKKGCASCGEMPANFRYHCKFRCRECYRELRFGELPPVSSVHFVGDTNCDSSIRGAWQENAIRELEDAGE